MTSFTRFDTDMAIRFNFTASSLLDGDYYQLMQPFTYHIDEYPSSKTVTVPAGFLSDGASIPRVFWSWASPIGRHAQAAFLHDYLCEYLVINEDGVRKAITRKEANKIFRESLIVLGVSKSKAQMMYLAVEAYRIALGKDTPSFNSEKYKLEEEIRKKLLSTP